MNLEKFKKKRSNLRSSATKIINQSEELMQTDVLNLEVEHLEDNCIRLNDINEQLKNLNNEIESLITIEALDSELEASENYFEKIFSCTQKIKRKLHKVNAPVNISGVAQIETRSEQIRPNTNVKLPKISIEKYSGDPKKFLEFWNCFDSAVHSNNSLTKLEKMVYLKSFLMDRALNVVSGFELSDENYDSCVKLLEDRYGRKDLIINSFMNKILNLEPVKSSYNISALRKLYDELDISIRNLEAMNVTKGSYGHLLIPVILRIIPNDLILEFNRRKSNKEKMEVTELIDFLKTEIECREASLTIMNERNLEFSRNNKVPYENKNFRSKKQSSFASTLTTNTVKMFCCFCRNDLHFSEKCDKFSDEEKRVKLRNEGRCYRCYRKNHLSSECKSKVVCEICKKSSHNKIFCRNTKELEEKAQITTASVGSKNLNNVLLQTCAVKVVNNKNCEITRIMFDSGSERSFIKSNLVRKLKLTPIRKENLFIYAFGNKTPREICYDVVKIKLQNLNDRNKFLIIEALVTDTITGNFVKSVDDKIRKTIEMRGINIADVKNVKEVKILIGGEYFWKLQTNNLEKINKNLFLSETLFGWTVQGQISDQKGGHPLSIMSIGFETVNEGDVNKTLKSFFDLESLGIHDSGSNRNDNELILREFESNLKYENGRYSTSLLWKEGYKEKLNNNFVVAKKRLENLIPRLKRDKWLLDNYNSVIKEQLELGIIEECELNDLQKNSYYMPHKPVIKKESETTKLRIVYDASSKQGNLDSLNESLIAGANLNPNILDLIIGFRKQEIAFSADIEKAYHQIAVDENDRDFLRFLYFDSEKNNELKCYRMARVPFGVACSSFLLAATIKCHVKKYIEDKPEAFEMLDNCIYVDDLFFVTDCMEKAYQLSIDAIEIFRDAGMNLRKFQSNSMELKNKWVENNVISGVVDNSERKILGLIWDVRNDSFKLEIDSLLKILPTLKCTKRDILKAVGKIFDPVGFISPFVIRVKFILQQLWELGLDFDEEIPYEVRKNWHEWCSEIGELNKFKIKREMFSCPNFNYELNVFCDASTKAYGCVAYVKDFESGKVTFVMSKSRVAPLKKLTLPRLELMAAVVAARVVQYLQNLLKVPDLNIKCWCDSQITLHWISGSANKWKQFVANRVQEIQSITDPSCWKFCEGKSNPADLLTRGCSAQKLLNSEQWWLGPPWLSEQSDSVKYKNLDLVDMQPVNNELRKAAVVLTVTAENNSSIIGNIVNKCSTWIKLLRVTVWCLRFIYNARKPTQKRSGFINSSEINEARSLIIKFVQEKEFAHEIKLLKQGKGINQSNNKLISLNPFLDKDGMLRVGGRLKHANISENAKHPLILPKQHAVTRLIILDSHHKYLHGGVQLINATIRQQYWIINSRVAIKSVINKCVVCSRHKKNLLTQVMGNLPAARVNPGRVFSKIGTDFTGPFQIRPRKGRGVRPIKTYVCVFICFIVKAVHLEVVSNLSTEAFVAALKRFVARRGKPAEIYSDCGTNFVGACRELKSIIASEEVSNFASAEGITWKFNPPSAPHFGGLWESAVKLMKHYLKRTVGLQILTMEEFLTYIAQIEACMNSRPLVPLSNDPNDVEVITPAHFLIGCTMSAVPEPNIDESKISIVERWKLVQQMNNAFWKRWSRDYISNLQQRNKWNKQTSDIKVGDLALIKEDNMPPLKWKMGRVKKIYPGSDNKVRVITLKTQNGEIKRPIHKLCVLPVDD